MKTMKFENFGGWSGREEKLVSFVNENNIKKEDITKIVYKSDGTYTLFYYVEQ